MNKLIKSNTSAQYTVYSNPITLGFVNLEAISKVNSCLSDIRRWMITNKLKINDSKTELIVFIFPQLRCDLSGLSVKARLRNH